MFKQTIILRCTPCEMRDDLNEKTSYLEYSSDTSPNRKIKLLYRNKHAQK